MVNSFNLLNVSIASSASVLEDEDTSIDKALISSVEAEISSAAHRPLGKLLMQFLF